MLGDTSWSGGWCSRGLQGMLELVGREEVIGPGAMQVMQPDRKAARRLIHLLDNLFELVTGIEFSPDSIFQPPTFHRQPHHMRVLDASCFSCIFLIARCAS